MPENENPTPINELPELRGDDLESGLLLVARFENGRFTFTQVTGQNFSNYIAPLMSEMGIRPFLIGSRLPADPIDGTLFMFVDQEVAIGTDGGGNTVSVLDSDDTTQITAANQGDMFLWRATRNTWTREFDDKDHLSGIIRLKRTDIVVENNIYTFSIPDYTYGNYRNSVTLAFNAQETNNDHVRVKINDLAVRDLRKPNGNVYESGELQVGEFVTCVYDSVRTRFTAISAPEFNPTNILAALVEDRERINALEHATADSSSITALQRLVDRQTVELDDLLKRSADLQVITDADWVTATDGALFATNRPVTQSLIDNASDWAVEYVPTFTGSGAIVVRLPSGANPSDYRVSDGAFYNVLLSAYIPPPDSLSGFDLYEGAYYLTSGETLTLQHHGTGAHTEFLGNLSEQLMARLLPVFPSEGSRSGKSPVFVGNVLSWLVSTGGGSGGVATIADTEGVEIARTNALPTAATAGVLTPTWTVGSVTGVSDSSGLLRVPKLRPSTPVMGFVVVAYEGDTKVSDTFLPFGAAEPDPTGQSQAYDSKVISWDNGEIVYVSYYHDNAAGDTISLRGAGVALPANASVRVLLAVAAGGNTGDSDQQQDDGRSGVSYVSPSFIQLTQWRRSSSEPSAPAEVEYVPANGSFTGFPDLAWDILPPSGSDPLWIATGTLGKRPDDSWTVITPDRWVITAEASSRIEFYNALTSMYQNASAPGFITAMRFWTTARDWEHIPIVGIHRAFDAELPAAGAEVSLPQIRLYEIDRLRFDFIDGAISGTAEISGVALFGDNFDALSHTADVADRTVQNSQSIVLRFGTSGVCSVQRVAGNGVPTSAPSGFGIDGGFIFNLYSTSDNKLDKLSIVSRFGIADENHITTLKITILSR